MRLMYPKAQILSYTDLKDLLCPHWLVFSHLKEQNERVTSTVSSSMKLSIRKHGLEAICSSNSWKA